MDGIARNNSLPGRVLRKGAARQWRGRGTFGGEHIAVGVHGDTLARRTLLSPAFGLITRNEPDNAVFIQRTDSPAAMPGLVTQRTRR